MTRALCCAALLRAMPMPAMRLGMQRCRKLASIWPATAAEAGILPCVAAPEKGRFSRASAGQLSKLGMKCSRPYGTQGPGPTLQVKQGQQYDESSRVGMPNN